MSQHRIDVLMSVFNGGRTIEETITSIRNQTVKDIKIIVVDDGSTDETKDILDFIAKQDQRLLVLSKPNTGIVDSLEVGLAQCSAPLIARHDADDISYSERFELQMAYLDAHPDCVAVSGGARYIDADGHDTGRTAKIVDLTTADANWIPAREPHLKQPFLMMRRNALVAAGGYRPLHVSEDSDLYWRLQNIGRLHNMDCLFGDYRVHNDSISSGSIRSGRIIAVYSQMVALSARRQIAGQPDLLFSKDDYHSYSKASTLSEIHYIASRQLDAKEQDRLRIAIGAKLIELCFYRNFELDQSDCIFIGNAIRNLSDLMKPANLDMLSKSVMQTALRLATTGRVWDAMQLLPLRQRPLLILRLAFRLGLPLTLRDLLKRSAHRRRSNTSASAA